MTMMLLESTMPHAMIYENPDKCPVLCEAMGAGGGHIPILLMEMNGDVKPKDVVVIAGESITSKVNASKPKWGDPCHTLTIDSRNYLIIRKGNDESLSKDHGSTLCEHSSR